MSDEIMNNIAAGPSNHPTAKDTPLKAALRTAFDSPSVANLEALIAEARREPEEKYNELIMAVASKFENESRHETALRYIREREEHRGGPECAKET